MTLATNNQIAGSSGQNNAMAHTIQRNKNFTNWGENCMKTKMILVTGKCYGVNSCEFHLNTLSPKAARRLSSTLPETNTAPFQVMLKDAFPFS